MLPSKRNESGRIANYESAPGATAVAQLDNLIPPNLRRANCSWQARAGASLLVIGKALIHKTS